MVCICSEPLDAIMLYLYGDSLSGALKYSQMNFGMTGCCRDRALQILKNQPHFDGKEKIVAKLNLIIHP